jgi:hypothetical protein
VPSSPTLDSLRALVAARFPTPVRKHGQGLPLGVREIDEVLGGGLPTGRLTELVCHAGAGGQLVLAKLLSSTRLSRRRVALIDATLGFAPDCVCADTLKHMVWVCPKSIDDTFAVANMLVRDANYAAVVIDLRGVAERVLRRLPSSAWHRLHRAAEEGPAVLVQTSQPIVPAVPWRLLLDSPHGLISQRMEQDVLADGLSIEILRGHTASVEELAG